MGQHLATLCANNPALWTRYNLSGYTRSTCLTYPCYSTQGKVTLITFSYENTMKMFLCQLHLDVICAHMKTRRCSFAVYSFGTTFTLTYTYVYTTSYEQDPYTCSNEAI